jgi:2-polyprenyl-3-methyl-5-hydroxy-6-metoxy-1,4-benzoquinol methylase
LLRRRIVAMLGPLAASRGFDAAVGALVRLWASGVAGRPPADALRRLLLLHDDLERRIDVLAIDLDGGIHAKHRLTRYHDFFVDRMRPGEAVLDVGCGKGELAHDLALRGGAHVTGIDVNPSSLAFARARFAAAGVEFVEADARVWQPPRRFDAIVLSNVLEHIERRVELLRRLAETAQPARLLIRVPSRERDWLVPLREELGLPWHSDPTHETEYTVEQLRGELAAAGLELTELVQRYGELWAVAAPAAGGAESGGYPDSR